MLEHQKKVLKAVADNEELFRKELLKSMVWLNSEELMLLRKWLKQEYWDTHKNIILKVLMTEAA